METKLINLVKANTKLIQIISYETLRVHGMLIKASNELNKDLFIWNRVEGIKNGINPINDLKLKTKKNNNQTQHLTFSGKKTT